MALTKEQWLAKLKSWVPAWFTAEPGYQEAVLQSLADLLNKAQTDAEAMQLQTFIADSEGGYLELHGSERRIERLDSETDADYSNRIRNFANKSNLIALKAIVDSFLINGECNIAEDFYSEMYLDRGVYTNRGYILLEAILNTFTIVVDNQTHAPFSLCDREYFASSEDFIGTAESSIELFDSIVAAVNKAKAFGTLYRLYERSGG
jgi:hypothetical protein